MEIAKRISEKEQVLQNDSVIESLSKNEMAVASLAISNPISQFSDELLKESVIKIAKGIIKDVGIKSTDLQYEVFRFLEVLKKYYSNLAIGEVKTAFELSMIGDLDEFLPKDKNGQPDRNHYQSFSLDYITKILKAFQAYKNQVWFKAVKAIPEPERIFSEEEREAASEAVKLDIIEKFERFKKDGILSDFVAPFLAVKVLHQNSIIVEIYPISDRDKRKSLMIVQVSNSLNEFEKNEIRRIYESGGLHPRHKAEAERVRDLNLIRETFEMIDKLEL